LSGQLHYLAPTSAHADDYAGPYSIRI
jgi:hypothetical protein